MSRWWTGQNIERPICARDGTKWHFRIWHGFEERTLIEKIFFWNEDKSFTGCMELGSGRALHISKIKQRMMKLVTDQKYRQQFSRELLFPVERNY